MLYALLTRRWFQTILLSLLLAGAMALRVHDPQGIQRLRHMTFDSYNRILPRANGHHVVIVDIDDESLRIMGQWPWPRTETGRMAKSLHSMGASAVGLDMVFAGSDRTSPEKVLERIPDLATTHPALAETLDGMKKHDTVFAETVKSLGNVVAGFSVANQSGFGLPRVTAEIKNVGTGENENPPDAGKFVETAQNFTTSIDEISAAFAGQGYFSIKPDTDGVIRSVPLFTGHETETGTVDALYPALSLEVLRVALNEHAYTVTSHAAKSTNGIEKVRLGRRDIPTDAAGRFLIHYAGHASHIYVPAWKVFAGQADESLIRGKIALLGTSSVGLQDTRATPLDTAVPGVEIHADIIDQILQGRFLRRPASLNNAELAITAAISLVIIFLAPVIGVGLLATLVFTLIAIGILFSLHAYQVHGLLIAPVFPALTVLTIFILSSILSNLRSEREKRAIRTAFGRYVSPALIQELSRNPAKLKLGGEVRDITVMFTDIRNFTGMTELMDPSEVTHLVNAFMTPMTSCVLDTRGTVDKYMGDAMMAFWNAPLDDAEHARHACAAALAMQKALAAVNRDLQQRAETNRRNFTGIQAGIGIHTGKAFVGNMGSRQRFAYSALGDTVNLASRLEGQTKTYGVSILVSGTTHDAAPDFAAIEVDTISVRGRAEPARIHALLGDAAMKNTSMFEDFAQHHAAMISAYRAGDWQKAEDLCRTCESLMPDIAGLYAFYRAGIAVSR